MSKPSINKSFIIAVALFTVLILALWFGYYMFTYNSIAATVTEEALFPNRTMFLTASFVLLGTLLIAIIALYRFLSVYIVWPITNVINEVAALDNDLEHRLPWAQFVGKPEFESLVYAINELIDRTESYSKEMQSQKQMLFDSEILQRDMRIGLLASQIDAHFVVNTITSIRTLSAHGENERAVRMADGLAKIIKHRHTGDELRNLFLELEMVEEYVVVMNIRFDGKFNAEYDFDDRLVEYLIPGLMIQPLVENALIHGLQGKDGMALIRICGYIEDKIITIEVNDNGQGMSPVKLLELQNALKACEPGDFPEPGLSGVALINIQRRILLWFGEGYGLSVDSAPQNGATVTIKLPAIKGG